MIKDIRSRTDVLSYLQERCSLPYAVQQKAAQEAIRTPLDYVQPEGYEAIVIEGADLIEDYYLKYLEKSKHAPDTCLASLKEDFGTKVIDMIERNL